MMEVRLEWIGIAAEKKGPVLSQASAEVVTDFGIVGDRRVSRRPDDRQAHRQVTIVSAEDLTVIARRLGVPSVLPAQLRRNLVVSGLELSLLEGQCFSIGSAVFEHTGQCTPCKRMDKTLGPGGRVAVGDRGGITARVIVGGTIHVGDPLRIVQDDAHSPSPSCTR